MFFLSGLHVDFFCLPRFLGRSCDFPEPIRCFELKTSAAAVANCVVFPTLFPTRQHRPAADGIVDPAALVGQHAGARNRRQKRRKQENRRLNELPQFINAMRRLQRVLPLAGGSPGSQGDNSPEAAWDRAGPAIRSLVRFILLNGRGSVIEGRLHDETYSESTPFSMDAQNLAERLAPIITAGLGDKWNGDIQQLMSGIQPMISIGMQCAVDPRSALLKQILGPPGLQRPAAYLHT